MSINNCQRSRRAVQIAVLTLDLRTAQCLRPWFVTPRISLGRLPVTVFKSLNDRQSYILFKFKAIEGIEGTHPIQTIICRLTTAKRSRRAV